MAVRLLWCAEDQPDRTVAIRRHTDRCFHAADEEWDDGFVVEGIFIPREEVAEIRRDADHVPPCRAPGTQD